MVVESSSSRGGVFYHRSSVTGQTGISGDGVSGTRWKEGDWCFVVQRFLLRPFLGPVKYAKDFYGGGLDAIDCKVWRVERTNSRVPDLRPGDRALGIE